jgi:hypothetical protein
MTFSRFGRFNWNAGDPVQISVDVDPALPPELRLAQSGHVDHFCAYLTPAGVILAGDIAVDAPTAPCVNAQSGSLDARDNPAPRS